MRRFGRVLIALAVLGSLVSSRAAEKVDVEIDGRAATGAFNRGLFSVAGYPRLYAEGNQLAQDSFAALNPAGTQARIETWISLMEPENDDEDPAHFAWDRLYPRNMHRFVTDEEEGEFMAAVRRTGQEPVLLLCYNAPWLAADGNPASPPRDDREWAEFAAAVLEYYNVRGKARGLAPVRYVEIWNEPWDNGIYWRGSRGRFHAFFNAVAARLHRDYPGVKVGGPGYLQPPDLYVEEFAEDCGDQADFYVFHVYNQPPEAVVKFIKGWSDAIDDTIGRRPPIMITESDHPGLRGAAKVDYLLDRQFRLLEADRYLLGFHQFCLPYYAEGASEFGLIHPDGAVVDRNYWPYWIFRALSGDKVAARAGDRAVRVVATRPPQGDRLAAVLYVPAAEGGRPVRARIVLPEGMRGRPLRLTVSAIGGTEAPGVREVRFLPPAAEELLYEGHVPAGGALGLTLDADPGRTPPWLSMTAAAERCLVGEEVSLSVAVLNQDPRPVSGRVVLAGLPPDWRVVSPVEPPVFRDLKPGEERIFTFAVRPESPARGAVYAYVPVAYADGTDARPHSVPIRLEARAPFAARVYPNRLYVAPGGQAAVDVTVTNTQDREIAGAVALAAGGADGQAAPFTLQPGEKRICRVALPVAADAKGRLEGEVRITCGGRVFVQPVEILVRQFAPVAAVPVDLRQFFTADAVTADGEYGDFKDYGGPFTLPAEFLPEEGPVEYLGLTLLFPSKARGAMNAVAARGQRLPVPAGRYGALYLLGNAVNGDKRGELTLVRADGSTAKVPLALTNWCSEAKFGEVPVIYAPHRHIPGGDLFDAEPQVFLQRVQLPRGGEIVALVLPNVTDMYIMAISLAP